MKELIPSQRHEESFTARRAWLASIILQQPDHYLSRLAAAVGRWRAMPRHFRRWLQRRAAATAVGAALLLALAGSAFITPAAHAAAINVDAGIVVVAEDGSCSLREAILNANSDSQFFAGVGECESGSGTDTINLPPNSIFTLTDSQQYGFYSGNGLPIIGSNIIIEGNGSTIRRDPAAPNFRIMAINSNGDLEIHDVTISGGSSQDDGGAIYSYQGTLNIYDSTISNNHAADAGGGLFKFYGEATIHGSTFSGNTAGDGAGIYLKRAWMDLATTTVDNNTASRNGGGLYNDSSKLYVTDSTIRENDAADGAGLFQTQVSPAAQTTITGGLFMENTAASDGGAFYIRRGELHIYETTITGNKATSRGGGLMVADNNALMTVVGSTIYDNTASLGGGVKLVSGRVDLINSTISNNIATSHGGGVHSYLAQVHLTNTTVTGNEAVGSGGGLYLYYNGGSNSISRSIISGNYANNNGSEIWRYVAPLTANNYNVFSHGDITSGDAFSNFTPGATDFDASDDDEDVALTSILNTMLGNNGGPTETHNLLLGSPALDIAPNGDCVSDPTGGVDQRGFVRPFDVPAQGGTGGTTCDAGAVEYASALPPDPFVFMSAKKSGTTGDGVAFDNSDILKWDGESWSKWFEGAAAFLQPNNKPKHNTASFWIPDPEDEEVIMSFAQNGRKVPGISPKVDGMDLVRWDGSAFFLYFDGSNVGLTQKTPEKIDGLHILPGSAAPDQFGNACAVYMLISTQGPAKVPNFGGGILKAGGEDVLGFCATNLGVGTAGFWHLVLDGSAEGMPKNATDSISLSDDGQTLYLTTKKPITIDQDGVIGGHSMVFAFDFTSNEFSGPHFSAPDNGLSVPVDGLHME